MKKNIKTKKIKKIIFALLLVYFLIPSISLVFAQEGGLEVSYPEMPGGIDSPKTIKVFLPRYIQYIYKFTVMIGGIVALLALIYGGFRYLTSAGSPATMTDARNQIFAGLIGLTVILGSYVVLYEINPDLISLELPNVSGMRNGIIVYNKANCAGLAGGAAIPELLELDDDILYKALKGSGSVILKTKEGNEEYPLSFFPFHSSDTLKIELHTSEDCEGGAANTITSFTKDMCQGINTPDVKCIKFVWWRPGLWVFNRLDNGNAPDPSNLPPGWEEGKDYKVFRTTQESLALGFNENIKAIALVPDKKLALDYGVILHNLAGDFMKKKGFSQIILPGNPRCITDGDGVTMCNTDDFHNISSITLFNLPQKGTTATLYPVTVCRQDRCETYQPEGEDDNYEVQIVLHPGTGELPDITSKVGGNAKYSLNSNVVFARNFDNDEWPEIDELIVNNGGDSGISGVKIGIGASYLVLLYQINNLSEYSWVRRNNNDAAIINRSDTSLRTIGMDDRAGTIVVIRTHNE